MSIHYTIQKLASLTEGQEPEGLQAQYPQARTFSAGAVEYLVFPVETDGHAEECHYCPSPVDEEGNAMGPTEDELFADLYVKLEAGVEPSYLVERELLKKVLQYYAPPEPA